MSLTPSLPACTSNDKVSLMIWPFAADIALGLTAALTALLTALIGWTHRRQHRALLPLAAIMATTGAWITADLARHMTLDPALQMLWFRSAGAAKLILPPLWLWFVLLYAGFPHWATRRLQGLLAIEPLLLGLISLSDRLSPLYWGVPQPSAEPVAGPLIWVHRAYGLGLILVTTALLIHNWLDARHNHGSPAQAQPAQSREALAAAIGLPLLSAILAPLLELPLLPPLAFGLAGLLVTRSLFRITPAGAPVITPLFDRLSDGLILVDNANRIVTLNAAAGAALGETVQDLLGRPLSEIRGLAALVSGDPQRSTTLFSPITRRTYQLGLVPMDTDMLPGITAAILLRDVTRPQPLDPSRQAPLPLAETNRILKHEILATISHELRTPLNAIVGYTSLLGQGTYGPLNERQIERLNRIGSSSQQLLHVVNNFLDLAILESTPPTLALEHVDLSILLDDCRRALESSLEGKDLSLRVELPAQIPPALADGRRLRQALDHLLDNAIKFTPSGSITLRVSHMPPGAPHLPPELPPAAGGWVAIAITDTGVGIDPQARPRIFEGFVQADSSTTRPYGGMGLGLAIARRLVEGMQGTIWVESVLGTGSTFTVLLPAALQPAPAGQGSIASSLEAAPTSRIDHVASIPHLAG